jgi:predicted HicB family RNase H-like nuclease
MTTLTHDGYVAEIDIDEDAGLLSGSVINTRATLHFAGRTVEELKQAFADTIADYRDWCASEGREPERPYSGALSLRIDPELHRRLATAAARSGKSLNAFIGDVLKSVA